MTRHCKCGARLSTPKRLRETLKHDLEQTRLGAAHPEIGYAWALGYLEIAVVRAIGELGGVCSACAIGAHRGIFDKGASTSRSNDAMPNDSQGAANRDHRTIPS